MACALLLVMVMVATMCGGVNGVTPFTAGDLLEELNAYRGSLLVKNMRKLVEDTDLTLTSTCPNGNEYEVNIADPNAVVAKFKVKSGGTAEKSDLKAGIDALKTTGQVATRKSYGACDGTDAVKLACQAYFIITYYAFDKAKTFGHQSCNSKAAGFAVFKTKGSDFSTSDYTSLVSNDRSGVCSCLPYGLCEFTPTTTGPLTSRLCIGRGSPFTNDAFISDLNDWRSATPALVKDAALTQDASTNADADCTAKVKLDEGGKTVVWLLKDGYQTTATAVGLKALLTGLDTSGDKDKYSDCATPACKSFLILKSDKVTKTQIAAQKCQNPAEKTVVAIVLTPKVLETDLDKQYSLLSALNAWRKGIVSTTAEMTATDAIKTKAQTEAGKCKTAVSLGDAEAALVSEKLATKISNIVGIKDEVMKLLGGYKKAATGKTTQKDCSSLSDATNKTACEKFFIMIYAAYTNGVVIFKNDCSDGKTVITFAVSKKATDYSVLNQQGAVEVGSTTQDSATTRCGASKVFAAFGFGASLLLILSLLQ